MIGKDTCTCVPFPGELTIWMEPPCASISLLAIDKPNPLLRLASFFRGGNLVKTVKQVRQVFGINASRYRRPRSASISRPDARSADQAARRSETQGIIQQNCSAPEAGGLIGSNQPVR
ncbi:MAG: hypothetical protein U5O16_23675 [Rhodococcus sp. (in: high G+C Gram-positive bacteria)]|uniref:hypothetical protein n=1 Tax=Rhodococcus sp. TaxID=1831 RepID=UPI002AD643D9|nr:hypothetical protein [Rhodococcus sp. (in: high G+C Gram-positive bacteria)]